jgi:membrane peptidoglycan carboxypeptidase
MSDYEFEYLRAYRGDKKKDGQKKRSSSDPQKPHGCIRLLILTVQLGVLGLMVGVVALISGYIYLSHELSGAVDQMVAYRGTGLGGTPRFYDRHGELLFELTTVEKRRWLAYRELPVDVINATVSAEDNSFWTNPGINPAAIVAAAVYNYRRSGERPVGASTITQQLVRHIVFDYEQRTAVSYQRKLHEIFLALVFTQKRSKQEIMEMYLNEIYYGNLAYGIEAAAQTYFGKAAADLNLAEAAFLSGLPQSPVQLNPYLNFDGAKARQVHILDLMLANGFIDYIEAEVAKGTPLRIVPRMVEVPAAGQRVLEAPHFVLYVQQELERRYGPDALVRGGWQVTTSLDLSMHKMAETAVREQVIARAANHRVTNGSVVILKPGTGEILAMVGSLDYFNENIDGQVNIALSPRQPGSSIKHVTYAAALEKGWTTGDVLWDVPIAVDLGGGELMWPRNYDGRFRGPLLLRDALANSYNIPPVQLVRDIGVPTFISTARRLGIESLTEPPGFYGLALTLGGGEVTLLELTHSYATLANMGQRPRLTSVLRITDSRGNLLYDVQQERIPPVNAISPGIAFILTDILDDDEARRPAMGHTNPLALPFPAAAKTGTTNDFRDNWTIGYTPGVVVGVWLGNADGRPMRNSSGLQAAAPVWNRIMQGIHADEAMMGSLMVDGRLPPRDFAQPVGVELRRVCLPQGTGGSQCTASRPDYFLVNAPRYAIPRLGYVPDSQSNPGAWTLRTAPLAAEDAQRVQLANLDDGTVPPRPTECVLNVARGSDEGQRLYLPVPPFYPDEVRARIWAQGTGYRMAPPVICSGAAARAAAGSGGSGIGGEDTAVSLPEQSAPQPVSQNYHIGSPGAGQQVNGLTPIHGTAQFDPAQVQYYKLEIGQGHNPTEWVTFGTTHSQPVVNGVLEQLQADALPPGPYVIRLILVRHDGNYAGPPHQVAITIGG